MQFIVIPTIASLLASMIQLISTQHIQWRRLKEINIPNSANNGNITIETEIFIRESRHTTYFMDGCNRKRDKTYNHLLCAEMCMVAHDCWTWMYNPNTHFCYRCDRVYGSTANSFNDHFMVDGKYELYEKVVTFDINPSLYLLEFQGST